MLTNININKMNQLTSENETAKQIVSQLLENHQTIVSMIPMKSEPSDSRILCSADYRDTAS